MEILLIIISRTLWLLISFLQTAMFIRAILSWFPIEENKFTVFLYAVTEPVIFPIRALFDKMNWAQNFPLDVPFFVTFIILSLISAFL